MALKDDVKEIAPGRDRDKVVVALASKDAENWVNTHVRQSNHDIPQLLQNIIGGEYSAQEITDALAELKKTKTTENQTMMIVHQKQGFLRRMVGKLFGKNAITFSPFEMEWTGMKQERKQEWMNIPINAGNQTINSNVFTLIKTALEEGEKILKNGGNLKTETIKTGIGMNFLEGLKYYNDKEMVLMILLKSILSYNNQMNWMKFLTEKIAKQKIPVFNEETIFSLLYSNQSKKMIKQRIIYFSEMFEHKNFQKTKEILLLENILHDKKKFEGFAYFIIKEASKYFAQDPDLKGAFDVINPNSIKIIN